MKSAQPPLYADLTPDDARLFEKARVALQRGIERHRGAPSTIKMSQGAGPAVQENQLLRAAWLTWPARLGPVIAAQLGAEPDKVTSILEAHIQREIAQLGSPDFRCFAATA